MKEMEYYKSLSENILYRGICVYCFLLPFMQNPYKPIFGESLATGKLQPTDILLALLTPLGIYHLLFARKYKDLLQYKGVVLVLIVYLISYNCWFRCFRHRNQGNHLY